MIYTKIVITNFHEKLRKMSFMFLRKIQMMKNILKKPRNKPLFKFSNPRQLAG